MIKLVKSLTQFYWKLIGWRLRYIRISICNLIDWFPIIWNDRNWSDYFIWEILQFKLKRQAKYIIKSNEYCTSKRDAQRIMLCVALIDKIKNEFYNTEPMDYHKANLISTNSLHNPKLKQLEYKIESDNFNGYFNKYPLIYKKVLSDKKLQVFKIDMNENDVQCLNNRISMNIALHNHNRAKKLLFKIIEDNIEKW